MQNSTSITKLLLRRVAAFLYDCLLLIAIYFIVTAAAITLNDGQAIQHWSYKIFLIVVAFIFFDWFWRHGGQTLGMRAWRLRVQDRDDGILTFKQSLIRFTTGLFSFGITLFFMYFSTPAEALHDKVSRTKICMYYK